jgi:hypothetical protein
MEFGQAEVRQRSGSSFVVNLGRAGELAAKVDHNKRAARQIRPVR